MKSKNLVSAIAGIALSGITAVGAYAADVTITALASDGSPLVGATVLKYSSGWTTAGITNSNGQLTIAGLSGNWKFSVSYNNTSAETSTITGLPAGNSPYAVPTFYTTNVTINGFDDAGNALPGITNIYYAGGGWRTFGTTDAAGTVSRELFPGSRNISSSYHATNNPQTILVDGDGFTAGKSTVLNSYLSRVNFKATSNLNANVQGVSITYYGNGGWRNIPATDANGESSYLLYPGNYTQFQASINGTTTSYSVVVPGNGTTGGQSVNVPLNPTRVKFDNAGSVLYYGGGGWRGISGANYYMFPGTYSLHFGSYSRNVAISGLNFERVASVIILKDHNGNLQSIDAIRGGSPAISYHVTGAVSNESPAVWIDIASYGGNNNRIFEVKKNGSISTQTKDVTVSNVFNFQTNLMTLKLQTCQGAPISGGHIRYGWGSVISSHWGDYTDTNGETSKEFFPGNFIIEMGINQSVEVKNVTMTGNDVFTWTTTLVKLHYPGPIAFGGAGVNAYFSGTKQMEMLPGTVNFSFRANGENIVPVTVPSYTSGCTYEMTPVIARLVSSTNAPLAGGTIAYYLGGWHNVAAPTKANGNTVMMLPGNQSTATSAMTYSGREQKNYVNLASVNNIIQYQTILTTITLDDTSGNPLVGGVSFYTGSWKPFGTGTTTGGTASMELMGSYSYSFAVTLNGTRQQMSYINVANTPNMAFHAKKVRSEYIGADCNPVENASASYYVGSWYSMGSTDASGFSSSIDMLPGGPYSFTVSGATQKNGIYVNNVDNLQTIQFSKCINNATRLANTPDANGIFKMYPNPATTELNIELTSDNTVVAVYSFDGRMVQSGTYNSGHSTINIAGYANGIYFLKVHNGNKVDTYRFTKL